MTDMQIMQMAISEARKSDQPVQCGVVIVKNGQVVAKAYNQQRLTNDPTAHAEIIALRLAGKKLGSKYLKDCIIYCTCEPCTMCLSAIIFAKIPILKYGTSMKEAFPHNLPISLTSKKLLKHTTHKMEIVGGIAKEACMTLVDV